MGGGKRSQNVRVHVQLADGSSREPTNTPRVQAAFQMRYVVLFILKYIFLPLPVSTEFFVAAVFPL